MGRDCVQQSVMALTSQLLLPFLMDPLNTERKHKDDGKYDVLTQLHHPLSFVTRFP